MQRQYDDCTYLKEPPLQFRWPISDNFTWDSILYDYLYTIKPVVVTLQKKSIIKNRGVFQAGGHCGLYPYLFTEYFDMVFTCEPNDISFYCLANNCQGKNIVKLNVALGKKVGRVESVCSSPNNTGMNKTVGADGTHYVPMITIDSLELNDIDLIQLDVEGFEYDALLGARKTIKRNKPVMIIENATKQIEDFLSTFGYVKWKQINRLDSVFVLESDMEKLNDS